MNKRLQAEIRRIANQCIFDMGDIFWDRDAYADAAGYADPFETARACIVQTLEDFATRHDIGRHAPRR